MTACIVTAYDGAHQGLADVTLDTIAAHAQQHGHALELAHETDLSVHFDYSIKVAAMRSLLPDHDVVVWIDSDSVVLDDAPDLAGLTADHWMAVGHRHILYASCLWALRRDPRSIALLDELWERRDQEMLDTHWHEKLGAPGDGVNVLSVQKTALQLITAPGCDTRPSTGVVHAATGQGNYLAIAAASLRAVRDARLTVRSDVLDVMLALEKISARYPWPPDHLTRSEACTRSLAGMGA